MCVRTLMRVLLLLVVCVCASSTVTRYELETYNSVATPGSVHVVARHARFTFLTDRLIRLEYSATGQFEDRPTLMAINRRTAVVASSVSQNPDGSTTISSAKLNSAPRYAPSFSRTCRCSDSTPSLACILFCAVTYSPGVFSPESLKVTSTDATSAFQTWSFGQTSAGDEGNLRCAVLTEGVACYASSFAGFRCEGVLHDW
jgi:hypothetical protein